MSTSYEVKEKDPKEHLKEKHEELYPKESVGPKKQKQRDSFRTENRANMSLFKCDKCKYTFKRTNEPEDHCQDYHCVEYNLNLNCKIGVESVIKSVSLNDDLKDNNVKRSTDVPANQELFKNSENKETENNRIKTYKELNCATCKNTPTEENSLGRHNRVTPDRKAWIKLNNPHIV